MFKDSFKYYKSRNPPPDLKDVVDFSIPDLNKVRIITTQCVENQQGDKLGLKPIKEWRVYELIDVPGLIFIENPFTEIGQQYWILKCLKDYSKKPNKLNLDIHNVLNDNESWWDITFGNPEKGKNLLSKLRWTTLGYHHNWDTKKYSEDLKTQMPLEIVKLMDILADAIGFQGFKAEAAIINYYRMNSTLAGHTDHSEINIDAPLFSISFGQTAIFLIGGLTQEEPAVAMYLRSGDIVVMSEGSRLRYHGVPKILPTIIKPWETNNASESNTSISKNVDHWKKAKMYISEARINMNIRQVLKSGQMTLY
ncbi:nucleic acid dioxygenase ALKBH1 [Cephus cinctus]|uniref:Nucleic acid dioxygenase ALKBH1 n=1 Tax=Cephus cinctus TaxID=211228 RepID=A0AAJ7VXY7_CEPCN|nr:nucleic acid dioxygenase ALKBH1 [Cephus cinctus]